MSHQISITGQITPDQVPMIAENGFEAIGVNAIANKSGVSKILIYRYFGSVEGLLAAYLHQNDFTSCAVDLRNVALHCAG